MFRALFQRKKAMEKAWLEGYLEGYEEGRREGYWIGREEAIKELENRGCCPPPEYPGHEDVDQDAKNGRSTSALYSG